MSKTAVDILQTDISPDTTRFPQTTRYHMSINSHKRRLSEAPNSSHYGRKRQKCTELQIASVFWDNLSKIHLTRKALQELDRRNSRGSNRYIQFNKAADMSEVKGAKKSKAWKQNSKLASKDRTSAEISSSTTRTSGPYDRNFQQHLIDNNILYHKYKYPDGTVPPLPSNWKEIKQILHIPLDSEPNEEDFESFTGADADAFKEQQVTKSVIPPIEGPIKDARCTSGGLPFRNLAPLTDGTIKPGNPDIYHGARPEQLDLQVREELRKFIIPSTQDELPICPNFFLAAKGPDGSLPVAVRQALYDGALGARGMHHLRNYGKDQPSYDNRASTITSLYHGGTLKLYTVHCIKPTGLNRMPTYCKHQLGGWSLTGSADGFAQGIMAYRRLRIWAEKERNDAIERANSLVHSIQVDPSPPDTPTASTLIEGEISPDGALYTTPPTGKQSSLVDPAISFPITSSDQMASSNEIVPESDSNKRSRQKTQGLSPTQQEKRTRVHNRHNLPSPESSVMTSGQSTGLSFQLEDHGIEQAQDEADERTEIVSSDEEC